MAKKNKKAETIDETSRAIDIAQGLDSDRVTSVTRDLQVPLTPEELLTKGEDMAAAELAITALETERSEINTRIADKRGHRHELAEAITKGTELRPVKCEWREDLIANSKTLVRLDTGEELERSALTFEDRQESLSLAAGESRDPVDDDEGWDPVEGDETFTKLDDQAAV